MKTYTSTGFRLLEILVSLSVVSIVLVGTTNISKLGFQHLEKSRDRQLASQFASSHLALLEQDENLTLGESNGSYSERFQWQLQLLTPPSTTEDPSEYNVVAVTAYLTVSSSSGSSEFYSFFLRREETINIDDTEAN